MNNALIATAKDIVAEKVSQGHTLTQVAEWIAKDLGTDVARLICADIAIDMGMIETAKGLANAVNK